MAAVYRLVESLLRLERAPTARHSEAIEVHLRHPACVHLESKDCSTMIQSKKSMHCTFYTGDTNSTGLACPPGASGGGASYWNEV